MTAAIYDFPAIAKAANLDALEGRPQNQVAPVEPVDPDPLNHLMQDYAYDYSSATD